MEEKFESDSQIQASQISLSLRRLIQIDLSVRLKLAKRLGIGLTDLQAIEHLMESPTIGPAGLSRKLGIKSASVTALLDRLETLGHLERVPHSVDRRKTGLVVKLSAIRAVIEHLQPTVTKLDAISESFSEEEKSVILKFLNGVTEVLSEHGMTS